MTPSQATQIRSGVLRFAGRRALVVGDVMLDRYVQGTVTRISPEAPVPVLRVEQETSVPGGAANVALNLARLGARVCLIGVIGDDATARELLSLLDSADIDTSGIAVAPASTTTLKERLMARQHQMLRCDREQAAHQLSTAVEAAVCRSAALAVSDADLVVCSDYGKGVFTPSVLRTVTNEASLHRVVTFLDPKAPTFDSYRAFTFITPNEGEFTRAFGVSVDDDDALRGRILPELERLGWRTVAITRGDRGVTLVSRAGIARIPGRPVEVFDVVGAGDTFIATLAMGVASGLDDHDAGELANLAGSIVVSKAGTAHTSASELLEHLEPAAIRAAPRHPFPEPESKLYSSDALRHVVLDVQSRCQTVVFTNGCFDVLHRGHLHLLREAKRHGDFLVVALNTDVSVKQLKGPTRPVFPLEDRMLMLAAFPFVDAVVSFDERTPAELVQYLRPDVIVKGGDYNRDTVIGADVVESRGGKVVLVDLVSGRSTTSALARAGQGDAS